ncbi:glycoside hydrolase family 30 protein [Changpingibacter yushuensis]|uniref:glycoside hydrolase family 30 protein n=1 Tax=Changpingibacter yushuensis TaxID=2758440 RepID=UPI001FE2A00E|nr:glycoside hydrolase family 30 beta sandwich domain-containing protein [Changpingibacter yushuensis]
MESLMEMTDENTAATPTLTWVVTGEDSQWTTPEGSASIAPMETMPDAFIQVDQPAQEIEGFGACFSELGWAALSRLTQSERDSIMEELFTPGVGANLSLCRMPIGANDFASDWYSYDETPGDHALEHFSIEHDLATQVPFIHSAQERQPNLKLWASPWSPPTWLKTNGHYACALPVAGSPQAEHPNGLRPDQVIEEGTDGFVLTEENLITYAAYFGRFIDAYREQGIDISMVMPQNEFNSSQIFPSCTWTPSGLSSFIAHLAPEMDKRGIDIFLGTMERPDDSQVEQVLADPDAGPNIKGVGFQWAGKGALPFVNHAHPELRMYMTEQECGDGKNDWRYARYAWTMLQHYFANGATAYDYWNIALDKGGVSRWGWSQNSFVTVDPEDNTYSFNYEYYLFKHLSHFVQAGAHYLPTLSYTGYEKLISFANPDGSIVILAFNDMSVEMPVRLGVGSHVVSATLPADSFSTFVVPAEALAEAK